MKELTIEQKAKAYDYAIKRAKELLEIGVKDTRDKMVVLSFFPELKESEDERIRKELISHLKYLAKYCNESMPSVDKWLTWLEKQGTQILANSAKTCKDEQKTVPDWMPKFLDELRSKKNYFDWDEYKDIEGGILAIINWMNPNYFNEKDGEQKPTDKVELKFKVGDKIRDCNYKGEPIYEIQGIDSQCYICKYIGKKNLGDRFIMHFSLDNPYLKLVEQKSNDKVEPKFHEGDWIIGDKDNTVHQVKTAIENVSNGRYAYDLIDGGHISTSHENDYHLWTINNAKDGDVLASEDKDKVFIYNGKLDLRSRVCAYCGIYKTYDGLRFTECAIGNYFTYKEPHPATKKQRDILMKAMADAGYTFDFEKKELKQKPDWSEEDKDFMYDTLSNLTELKDRYGDGYGNVGKCIEWVKSIRPQKQWKPSNDQIVALEHFVRSIWESEFASPYNNNIKLVYLLLNQLKKLKE